MKISKLVTAGLCCAVLSVGLLSAGEEGSWMDMKNCDMCKSFSSQEGLMEHMTWEHHEIASGMLSVTTVADEFKSAYEKAKESMQATQQRLMKGEEVKLCNACKDMGALMQAGAKMEAVPTLAGDVMLMTSTDPAVVERIHEHARKTNEFMEKAHAEHKGHGH